MNRWVKRALWASGALLVAAIAVTTFGLVNVAASSGHWPITSWVLHYTMRRSVETRAVGIEAPPLDEPALIVRGAGHYATGCAPCHGAPGARRGPIVREMTPVVPPLDLDILHWRERELFWIVKHGVKYTAMPAWVAPEHETEIWSVVAFLKVLPTLSPAQYRELAYGPSPDPNQVGIAELDDFDPALADCIRCHARDGTGREKGAFPRLDLQSETYLYAALASYATGQRSSGIMQPIAERFDAKTLRELARFYADRGPQRDVIDATAEDVPAAELALGRRIASEGLPQDGVPPCSHCHGPRAVARNPYFPDLAGQYRRYIVEQLELFHRDVRGGGPYAPLMSLIASQLEPHEMRAVASWYASLTPATDDALAARD